MQKKHAILNKIVPALLAVICLSLFVQFAQYQIAINTKKQELADLQSQLNTQMASNEELNRSLANGENAIIERIAREQGYAKPNERVFVDISGK